MCGDLQDILRGHTPRQYGGTSVGASVGRGAEPSRPGSAAAAAAAQGAAGRERHGGGSGGDGSVYECLAPSPLYDKLLKLKRPLG